MTRLTLTQRKRLDILDAARAEFLDSGFRETSMDRVSERAGVSKRTVYNHLPSKDELFAAVARQFIDELTAAIRIEYDPDQALDSQLREIGQREVKQVTSEDYVAMFRLFITEAANFPGMFDDIVAEHQGGHDPVMEWIGAAAADGRLDIPSAAIPLACNQFTSLIKGALFWPLVSGYGGKPSKAECDAVIDGAVNLFLSFYQRA